MRLQVGGWSGFRQTAPGQHFGHPFVCLLMGFEAIYSPWPSKFESLVKLHRSLLQSHSSLPTVRRFRAPPDEAVNLFLDVDERLFHCLSRLDRDERQSKDSETKRAANGIWQSIAAVFPCGERGVRASGFLRATILPPTSFAAAQTARGQKVLWPSQPL